MGMGKAGVGASVEVGAHRIIVYDYEFLDEFSFKSN